MYRLIGPDGQEYVSETPGSLGGHRANKGYGNLDACGPAKRALAAGTYQRNRVFFADAATAMAAGYRPCGLCRREEYRAWRADLVRPRIEAVVGPAVVDDVERLVRASVRGDNVADQFWALVDGADAVHGRRSRRERVVARHAWLQFTGQAPDDARWRAMYA